MQFKSFFIPLLISIFAGCGSGYKKIDGKWAWVRNDASEYKVHKMDVDQETFRVLKSKDYAVDKNHVYHGAGELEGVDPNSYEQFDGTAYAKDKNNAYFGNSIIVEADPATFKILDYPYARDAQHIFIGCLRMNVDSPDDFRVSKYTGSRRDITLLRSRTEVVKMFGDEFEGCTVLYDDQKRDERYAVQVPGPGYATDGKWTYIGPRKCTKVQ